LLIFNIKIMKFKKKVIIIKQDGSTINSVTTSPNRILYNNKRKNKNALIRIPTTK